MTVFFWYAYVDTRLKLNKISLESKIPFLEEDEDNEQIILWMAIISTIVSFVLLLITCALRTRVRFVVALFREAASCIRSMPLILLQPIWTLLSLTVFLMFWVTVIMSVATADHAKQEKRQMSALRSSDNQMESSSVRLSSFTLIDYSIPDWTQYMWWYLIIAFVWTSEFILSCQQMVIAGILTVTPLFDDDLLNSIFQVLSVNGISLETGVDSTVQLVYRFVVCSSITWVQ